MGLTLAVPASKLGALAKGHKNTCTPTRLFLSHRVTLPCLASAADHA